MLVFAITYHARVGSQPYLAYSLSRSCSFKVVIICQLSVITEEGRIYIVLGISYLGQYTQFQELGQGYSNNNVTYNSTIRTNYTRLIRI